MLITAGASLSAAAAFAWVAWGLSRRPYPSHVRWVGLGFVTWWAMFGFEALTDGLRVLLAVGGDPDVAAYMTLARLKIVAAGIAVWGLGYYVLYLWTGSSKWAIPVGIFAALHAFYFLFAFELRDPSGVTLGDWAPRLVLAEPGGMLLGSLGIVFFFLPPMLLAIGLLALVGRLDSRTRRFRVVSVAVVILVWHATQLVQANPATSGDSPVFAILSLANVATALLAYTTYYPPSLFRDRLGLKSLTREADRPNNLA